MSNTAISKNKLLITAIGISIVINILTLLEVIAAENIFNKSYNLAIVIFNIIIAILFSYILSARQRSRYVEYLKDDNKYMESKGSLPFLGIVSAGLLTVVGIAAFIGFTFGINGFFIAMVFFPRMCLVPYEYEVFQNISRIP